MQKNSLCFNVKQKEFFLQIKKDGKIPRPFLSCHIVSKI